MWKETKIQNLLLHINKLQNTDRKFLNSNFFLPFYSVYGLQKRPLLTKELYWYYFFLALRKTTIKDKYMTNEVTIFFRETIRSTFDDTEKAKQQQHGLFKGQRYLSY